MAQNRKIWQVVILILFVAVVAFLLWTNLLYGKDEVYESAQLVNKPAPSFKVQGLDGNTYSLAQFKGKAVVLNFWASWCEPCRNEMPLLETYYQKHKDSNFVVLGMNLSENVQTVRGFVREYKLNFPILLDQNAQIETRFGVDLYPTTFFINSKGVVVSQTIGELDEQTMKKELAKILKE